MPAENAQRNVQPPRKRFNRGSLGIGTAKNRTGCALSASILRLAALFSAMLTAGSYAERTRMRARACSCSASRASRRGAALRCWHRSQRRVERRLWRDRITGRKGLFDSFVELAVADGAFAHADAGFAVAVSGRARLPLRVPVSTRLAAIVFSVPLMVVGRLAFTGGASALTGLRNT